VDHLVSVITPSYNVENYIAATIESVIKQTYANWELLITDDASTDATTQIIEAYQNKDPRIKLIKLDKNSGIATARNTSIKVSKGRFIAFLDADDVWYPEKLDLQIKFMLKKRAAVSFSSYRHINEDGQDLNIQVNALEVLTYSKLLKNNYIGNLTGIYDAHQLGKIYAPGLKKRQDWCIWLQALKQSTSPAFGIPQPLANYCVRTNSVSRSTLQLLKYNFQVYHTFLGFNVLKSTLFMLRFLVEYFVVRPKYISKL